MKSAYSQSATVASEALGAIRTVTAFGNAQVESTKYNVGLVQAERAGMKKGRGSGMGLVRC